MTEDPEIPFPASDDEDDTSEADGDDTLWFEGAAGVDPDMPDPGCQHDWRNLTFTEGDDGLVCTRCGRLWYIDDDDGRDAMLSLWHSTRRGLAKLEQTQEKLVALVEALTGKARCHWCDRWDDEACLVVLGERRACPEHVGCLLGAVVPADDDELDHGFDWAAGMVLAQPSDLYSCWLADKAALECDALDRGSLDASLLSQNVVTTQDPWRSALRLGNEAAISDIVAAVAVLLELPRPVSRPGRNLLLGVLARTAMVSGLKPLMGDERLFDILLEAAPSTNRDRATVILDLFRHEMPEDGTVSGDMADDLVEAFVHRAAGELASVFS